MLLYTNTYLYLTSVLLILQYKVKIYHFINKTIPLVEVLVMACLWYLGYLKYKIFLRLMFTARGEQVQYMLC